MGLHAPSHGIDIMLFWKSLIDLLKHIHPYACMNILGYNEKINYIIIIGDLNVFEPNTQKKRFFTNWFY